MGPGETASTIKVLFDTDIGSDIDDACALAYLLAEPRCELLGITTVSGLPVERAKLASVICRAAGQDISIIPGISDRLDGPTRQPYVPQASILKNWGHSSHFRDQDAVGFMANTIRTNPGDVVLLAVGPMTNVATLFMAHPDVPPLLRSIYMMCGRFSGHHGNRAISEWNAHCDPAAAAITYSTAVDNHTSIGLDVTNDIVMNSAEISERFQHPFLQPVLEMSGAWFSGHDLLRFHDPLAAVTVFEPGICGYEYGTVTVVRSEGREDGTTNWISGVEGPHRVGANVDASRFFDSYFDVFS